jgi:thiamine biosynthesis lipoprotein
MKTFETWGLTGVLALENPHHEDAAMERLQYWIKQFDDSCNRFRGDSEISMLNQANGKSVRVSATFERALRSALYSSELTNGLCDPTILGALVNLGYDQDFDAMAGHTSAVRDEAKPSPGVRVIHFDPESHTVRLDQGAQLDLGASAKALVADIVADECASFGGALVEIGGDVAVRGQGSAGPWVIGISDSLDIEGNEPRIAFSNGGVATSSTNVRQWRAGERVVNHIVDPRTGDCALGMYATASVAAKDCVTANAFATASLLWDEEAGYHIAQAGWSGRLVRHDGDVDVVGGWPQEELAA